VYGGEVFIDRGGLMGGRVRGGGLISRGLDTHHRVGFWGFYTYILHIYCI
jgi:hypothetical protein